MAWPGHAAWAVLAGVLLLAAGAAAQSSSCVSATFQGGRAFQQCNALPVLGASLHWTYHAANGTADVAFRAPQQSGGWVAWGINTRGTTMPGSSVFIASQDASGAVSVTTTVLESVSPSLTNGSLSFDVLAPPAADYAAGVYTIFATIALPNNSTTQNTVWQAGPGNTGSIAPHSTSGANVQSMQRLDFMSGQSTGASNSRLHRRNIHGILNGVSWGILIPLGAMIARYLRVFEAADPAWFYLHITCQLSGYVLGVAGWALGLKLGSESKGVTYGAHRNIGIAIFCLATLQVFALLLRPDKKNKYRFYWNIYHHSVGYSAIVLAAVNIFKGLDILKPASGWKKSYIAILATLAAVALLLEAITWVVVLRRKKSAKQPHGGAANGNGWQHQQGA